MKIGISTSTFFNTVATESMFELMRKMRVDTTEVCLQTFSEYEKAFVDKMASFRNNMDVVAVSPLGMQFEPQLFSPNLRVRTDAELLFKKVCYACFMFGSRFYTFRGPVNYKGPHDIDYSHLAQRFAQLSDIAASYGVSLSLKNMRWSFAAAPDFFKKIVDLCPRLYVSLDMFNAESAGYDLREFLDVVPVNRLTHINVADFVKGEWCLPGKGKYNFERFFADLVHRKINAPVLIAARSNCYADFLQVRDSVEYLNGIFVHTKV